MSETTKTHAERQYKGEILAACERIHARHFPPQPQREFAEVIADFGRIAAEVIEHESTPTWIADALCQLGADIHTGSVIGAADEFRQGDYLLKLVETQRY